MSAFGSGPGMSRAMTFDARSSTAAGIPKDPSFKPLVRRNTTFTERKEDVPEVNYDDVLYRKYFGESPSECRCTI
jgi:hypothetical protein